MSVGENMAMGYGYPRRWRLIDWAAVNARRSEARSTLLGSPLPLDRPVAELSRAEKSIVAIARALVGDAELLVLDEPTASLPEADVARLFAHPAAACATGGVGIIYVTHRLDEVFRIADAVTVLRDGRTVARLPAADALSPDQLVADIVGRAPRATRRAGGRRAPAGACGDEPQVGHVGPVSFASGPARSSAWPGCAAHGHEAVGRVIGGRARRSAGTIIARRTAGTTRARPPTRSPPGIGFATGKRAEEALAGTMTVKENLFLNPLNFGQRGFPAAQPAPRARGRAATILQRFDVRPPDPRARHRARLSGGNQQKVVLARWAGQHYRVLVLEDPTIGVDFGAKTEIYRMMAGGRGGRHRGHRRLLRPRRTGADLPTACWPSAAAGSSPS